jgi:hypothetical protein
MESFKRVSNFDSVVNEQNELININKRVLNDYLPTESNQLSRNLLFLNFFIITGRPRF